MRCFDVEISIYNLHHTINIPASRVSLCVSAHLLHLIFCPSLWLYYFPRISLCRSYYYGCVDNISTACRDQLDPQPKKRQRKNRESGRRTDDGSSSDTSSVVDTKIQNVVLTSYCSLFYTYQSGMDERCSGFAFISPSYFPSPSAFYWVAACSPDRLCRNSVIGNGCYTPGGLPERVKDRYHRS